MAQRPAKKAYTKPDKKLSDMTANELLTNQSNVINRSPAFRGATTTEIKNRTQQFTEQAEKHQANNPERYASVTDEGFFRFPDGTVDRTNTSMSPRHIYSVMNWGSDSEHTSNQGQAMLPGMEHIDETYKMPVPKPLVEVPMAPRRRDHVEAQAAMYGVTWESAVAAAGAAIDNAFKRDPHHESFYSAEGQDSEGVDHPRERLLKSIAELSTPERRFPAHVHAASVAMTSQKTKFSQYKVDKETGRRTIRYTNDENARAASAAGLAGGSAPDEVMNPPGNSGFHTRTQAAARVAAAVIHDNQRLRDVWDSDAPKTGPFHNSWVDHSGPDQFWVSDTHSGAPTVAPHLTSEKDKEAFLDIQGIHPWIDDVHTEAMRRRGLTSKSGTQSAQWNYQRDLSEREGNRSLKNQHIHTGRSSETGWHNDPGPDGSMQDGLF